MDLLFGDNRPEACLAVGLDCRTCVERSAANLAQICHGLDSAGLHRIFFQMYPSEGCSPMAGGFALSYYEAKTPLIRLGVAAAA
ncbi:MAG TPA: hypothetical protein VKU01_13905 [Bryobacteraceae bacterium]|nr:hypothetical protein [Bryobacteraceae bacterium]